jgi:hypothetical protein
MSDEGEGPPNGGPRNLDGFTKSPNPDTVPVEDIVADVQVEVIEGVDAPDN